MQVLALMLLFEHRGGEREVRNGGSILFWVRLQVKKKTERRRKGGVHMGVGHVGKEREKQG